MLDDDSMLVGSTSQGELRVHNPERCTLTLLSAVIWTAMTSSMLASPVLAQPTTPDVPSGELRQPPPEATPYVSPDQPAELTVPRNEALPPPTDYNAVPPPGASGSTTTDISLEPPEVATPRRAAMSEGSFFIGVPIWFTPKNGVVQPGVSFEARIARRFGLVAPELTVGWQINWIDKKELPQQYRAYNLTIDSLFISAGARVYALRDSPVTPFISGAFDLSFWHLTGSGSLACGYYYCTTAANYDVSVGISGRLGVAFAPSESMQLEIGARIAMVFEVGPFEKVEAWVSPFLGFTARI